MSQDKELESVVKKMLSPISEGNDSHKSQIEEPFPNPKHAVLNDGTTVLQTIVDFLRNEQ